MSRLIVKNLPQTTTEDKVRELFSLHGVITDIQLKYTKEGKFRKFGFVGFQNEQEAEKAVKSLNNSFINTSKISVENCATLGDSSKPKSWSKYSADSTAFKKANIGKRKANEPEENCDEKNKLAKKKKKKSNDAKELLQKYKNDPMFKEFLKVHNKEDTLEQLEKPILKDEQASESSEESTEKIAEAPVSDMEYMNLLKKGIAKVEKKLKPKDEKKKKNFQLFTLKLIDLPYTTKKKDIKAFFKSNIPFSIRIPRQVKGIAFVGYKNEDKFKVALRKDKSFIKGRQIRVIHYVDRNESGKLESDSKKSKWKSQEDALRNEEDIAESGRIFIRNLSYTTTEKDLEDLFAKYGPLAEVNLPIDTTSRQPKGFGVVTFMMPEHAVKAYTELDGSILQGRMVHLLPGKAKDIAEDENINESSNFKNKKAAQLKSQAGSAHNWNTLFLGHDAVAGVMADTYGLTKDDLIGPDAKGSAATRLALGETQLVLQTRNYLEQHGVLVDMFNSVPKTRSKTVLLVKNLPPRTEAQEIKKLFGEHGELGRVILPPSGITAIVEFLEPSEARKAFLKLAYSKFKSVPLYLEWAPESSLSEEKKVQADPEQPEPSPSNNTISNEVHNQKLPVEEAESDEEIEPDTTLFVKNLNFITTDQELKKHFEGCGKLKHASVATKKDHNNPGAKLSMGYGFIQYYQKRSADKALKSLQQSVLDGKSLEIKRSEKTIKTEQPKSARKTTKLSKQNGSKILVRNVPFQAGSKELLELFKHFGDIKALRLPKKIDPGSNSHRGFAFVDYVSAIDAKNAFDTLSQSTHLFGRRLVLEWASAEEGVEEIRKKTIEHFGHKEEVKSKKAVYNMD